MTDRYLVPEIIVENKLKMSSVTSSAAILGFECNEK